MDRRPANTSGVASSAIAATHSAKATANSRMVSGNDTTT